MYHDLWYALPLIVSVSLVYAATRSESMSQIMKSAVRVGVWFGGFIGIVMMLLWGLTALAG